MAISRGVSILDPTDVEIKHEDLTVYFELEAIRRGRSIITNNGPAQSFGFNRKIQLLGFDKETQSYTTRWSDYEGTNDEKFGIETVTVRQTANFILEVEVTFLDIQGLSLVGNPENSPYSVLYDLPSALFVMRMKGYYGKSITTRLVLASAPPEPQYDPITGNYKIVAKFTSFTFAILRDIKLDYLLTAPFLAQRLNQTSQASLTVLKDTPSNTTINSTYQLIETTKEVNRIIQRLDTENPYNQEYQDVTTQINLIKELVQYRDAVYKAATQGANSRVTVSLDDNINMAIVTNSIDITDAVNSKILNRMQTAINFQQQNNLLPDVKLASGLTPSIVLNGETVNTPAILFVNAGERFTKKAQTVLDNLSQKQKELGDQINLIIDTEVQRVLGFRPTIRNVVKVLCDDADIFFSLFKDLIKRAENYHNENDSATETNIKENKVYAFPRYFSEQTNSNLSSPNDERPNTGVVELYPGTNPAYKEWEECNFIEAFLKTKVEVLNTFENLNSDSSPNTRSFYFPLSPKEVDKPYSGTILNSSDKLFENILKRFFIETRFTYGFTNTLPNDFITFLAREEAFNLADAISNTNTLSEFLTFCDENSDTIFSRVQNNVNFPKSNQLLNELTTASTINYIGEIYQLGNDANFDGLTVKLADDSVQPLNPSTSVSERFNGIAQTFNNKASWMRSRFFNGSDIGQNIFVASSNGYLYRQDKLYEENRTDLWKTDYSLKNPNGSYVGDSIGNALKDQILATLTSSTISSIQKFIQTSRLFYNYGRLDLLQVPSIQNLPIASLYIIYDDMLNSTITSSNSDITALESFLTRYSERELSGLTASINVGSVDTLAQKNFFNILGKRSYLNVNSTYSFNDPTVNFSSWNVQNTAQFNSLFKTFLSQLKLYVQINNSQNNTGTNPRVESGIENDDLKFNIYTSFRTFYEKWVSGDEDYFNDEPIINFFRFLDRANRDIGDKCIVNYEGMVQFILDNKGKSLYECLGKLYYDNYFNYFPFESFLPFSTEENGNNAEAWTLENVFEPSLDVELLSFPSFSAIYSGGYSSRLNVTRGDTGNLDDSFSICDEGDLPTDIRDGNVYGFVINYGSPEQNFVESVTFATQAHNPTSAYLAVTDQLARDSGNPSNSARVGQNLLDVYETYSYQLEGTCLGNMMIQPLQFVCLQGVPLFNGTYMIFNVTHSLAASSMNMKTKFSGTRLLRYPRPLANQYATTIKAAYQAARVNPLATVTPTQNVGPLTSNGLITADNGGTVSNPFSTAIVIPPIAPNSVSYSDTIIQNITRF